ncbi:MAG: glycosyltransferase [Crocinitomicaceae bacterium]|nr:glycosyltransferase [Crocinitomicaceae bacterium]MBK8926143.1 glycosyltransferase [Crocinitomicaceae bacterium]
MEPVFSVITVHFNQLPWLKSTVNNVLAQKGFGELIEYIIVDGLSNDGTLDYLHSIQFQNSIHRIIGRDKGIYDAMNKGIAQAKGKYCIFMNAGDHFCEDDILFHIHTTVSEFDVLYGDTEINYHDFTRTAKALPLEKFWKSLPFVHQSVIVKTSLLKDHPFDLTWRYCADYEQLASLYKKNHSFQYLNKTISVVMAGGASDMNRTKATREVFSIAKKIFNIGFAKKINFRFRIFSGWLINGVKKILPKKANGKLARAKYVLKK